MSGDTEPQGARASWEKFLNVDTLRASLTSVSVYLTAYEFLVEALVVRPRQFFTEWWQGEDVPLTPDYEAKVLSRHKMPYYASADWFKDLGALDEEDIEDLRSIREHRNFIAHNVPDILTKPAVAVDPDVVDKLVRVYRKLDLWWLLHVEMANHEELDDIEITDEFMESTFSMRFHSLTLLLSLASGDEKPLRDMFAAFDTVWKEDGER